MIAIAIGAGGHAHISFAPAGGVLTNAREYLADDEEAAEEYQGAEATGAPVKGGPKRMHMKAYQRWGHVNIGGSGGFSGITEDLPTSSLVARGRKQVI